MDANVFLELQLAQRHASACRKLFERVRDGLLKVVTTDFHVDTVVLIMENYGKTWRDIAMFLTSLLRYRGLLVHVVSLQSKVSATRMMRDYGLDFDDALAVQALKDLSLSTVISYDDDFDAVDWVRRLTPEQVVGAS